MRESPVPTYLNVLDAQRQAMFAVVDDLDETQIWQRRGAGEWSIGEICSHTVRFYASFWPALRTMWTLFAWYGRLRRNRPYKTDIENVYKRPNFPLWTGFLWKPEYTPENPVSWASVRAEIEAVHVDVRAFYSDKDPDVLGHINAWDPAIGVVNLITGLKVCIDHDQLHYEDVIAMAAAFKSAGGGPLLPPDQTEPLAP